MYPNQTLDNFCFLSFDSKVEGVFAFVSSLGRRLEKRKKRKEKKKDKKEKEKKKQKNKKNKKTKKQKEKKEKTNEIQCTSAPFETNQLMTSIFPA